MAEATTTALVPVQEMQKLPELISKYIPILEKWNKEGDEALDEIPDKIETKEQAQEAIETLAYVRDVYNGCQKKRKEMTEITDSFKDFVMEFERPFDNNRNSKNKYNQKLKAVEDFQQREHDRVQKEKAEAAKKKEIENHKIDLKAKIQENLHKMVIDAVQKADSGSADWFKASTLQNFDERAETFKSFMPKLKMDLYGDAFRIPDQNILSQADYALFVVEIQKEETFEKWNSNYTTEVIPVVNAWRARIPELKQKLQEVEDLAVKDKEAAEALKKKQQEEEAEAAKQRQLQLDLAAQEAQSKINEEANLSKMSNEFAAQAVTQNIGDAGGRTKLVLKFTDPNLAPKALMAIMYSCMSHPDFQSTYPCFQKRDAKKKLMVDDKGRPVYIDAVKWWVDWFLANCDADVPGTTVSEDAKVTVRK